MKRVEAEHVNDREEGKRKRRSRARVSSPPKQKICRLTEENLRGVREAAGDFEEGHKRSSLNRPLGDMTRTYLEGIVLGDEVEEV